MDLNFSVIPPNSKEAESAVLGAILMDNYAFETVSGILTPECFYSMANMAVFQAMKSVFDKASPIDLLTVVAELKSTDKLDFVGGPFYLTRLTDGVISTANVEAHARIIYQNYLAREMIRLGGEMVKDGYNPETDPLSLVDRVHLDVENIRNKLYSGKEVPFSKEVSDVIVHSLKARDNEGMDLIGIDTGSQKLNRLTGGWQAPDLIVIAARPGCGKTSLSLDLAERMASLGTPVGFASLEMSSRQLITKLLSKRARLSAMQIMRGNYSQEQAQRLIASDKLGNLPIFINDRSNQISEIRSWAYKIVRKHGVKALFFDYLQLAGAYQPGRNRENEIAEISKQCKQMAKSLNVPVFLLSQLSRAADQKRPTLATLRESGAIEQDADQVIFIYDDPDAEYSPQMEDAGTPKPVHVEWAKYRLGTPGAMKATFHMRYSFFDFDGDNGQEALPF